MNSDIRYQAGPNRVSIDGKEFVGPGGEHYIGQGEGHTFYPEGTPVIILGPESWLTNEEVSNMALSILRRCLEESQPQNGTGGE